jgi:hypothetical protein
MIRNGLRWESIVVNEMKILLCVIGGVIHIFIHTIHKKIQL